MREQRLAEQQLRRDVAEDALLQLLGRRVEEPGQAGRTDVDRVVEHDVDVPEPSHDRLGRRRERVAVEEVELHGHGPTPCRLDRGGHGVEAAHDVGVSLVPGAPGDGDVVAATEPVRRPSPDRCPASRR